MKMAKRVISIMLVVITLISVVSVSAEALRIVVKDNVNYGYMVPVNYNGTEVISTVKVYGSYDYINFYAYTPKNYYTYFAYEIYSDKKLTKCVQNDVFEVEGEGAYSFTVKLKLKGNFSTKTYYVVTYAANYDEDNDILKVDANSMCKFNLKVDRTTSFSKQKVMLKEVKNTTKGAYIKWSALSGTNKYNIYRRSITGTKWTKVGSVSKSKTSFTDTSVKNKNGNYIYTVKAVNKKGTVSRYHYKGLTCLFAKTPVMKSIEVAKDNAIEIKWGSTSSSAQYTIMRKEGDGSWKTIWKNYSKTSYRDTTVESGKEYTYSVKAVLSTSYGKATSSYYANADKAVTYLEAPHIGAVSAVENGVEINWDLVEGSVGYNVYRKPFDGSTGWKTIGEVESDVDSYIDTTASLTDGEYLYSVRSKAQTNKGSYDYNGKAYFVLQNPEFEVKQSSGSFYLQWEAVPKANGYVVYSRVPGGEWKKEDKYLGEGYTTCKLSFPTPGEREFALAARYQRYSNTAREYQTIYSDYENNTVTLVDYPDLSPAYYLYTDKISFYWSDLGAEGYNVYKMETFAENKEPHLIASLSATELNYVDTDVEIDVQYTYVIKGIYNGVEQTEGVYPCNIKIYPKESITENINIYYSAGSVYDGIRVAGDVENAILYLYEEATDSWRYFRTSTLYDNNARISENVYTWANFDNNGKIKIGVSFLRENGRTAIDDYVLELDSYKPQTTITQTCTKKGVKITLTPDKDAVSYRLKTSYDLLDEDVVVDVSDGNAVTHTFKATEMNEEGTGIKYGFISAYATRGDGSRTGEAFELRFVAPPTLVDAKKNSAGYPVVKWSKSKINSDGTMHIYRKAPGGDWECISTVETSSLKTKKFSGYSSYNYYFVDKTAEDGVEYTYTVQQEVAVRNVLTKSYLNKTGVTTN